MGNDPLEPRIGSGAGYVAIAGFVFLIGLFVAGYMMSWPALAVFISLSICFLALAFLSRLFWALERRLIEIRRDLIEPPE